MEVHHHSHPAGSDNHRNKKKWTHYFWEFLMLFLAVFCGFLAEYQLEHKIERDREKQFIASFIEDLKTDTAAIRQNLHFRKQKMERMDSLLQLLSNRQIKGHENELYYFGRTLIRNAWFQSNDRTIIQLKNSGSLRLIRNEEVADSIISYQKLVDIIQVNQDDERNERVSTIPVLSRLFNPFEFDKMMSIGGITRPTNNPALRSYDENLQQDLALYIHFIKGSTYIIEERLQLLHNRATNILLFLKRKYHLK